ncbi:hypothetical protein ACFPAG_17845 [Vogesella sp. GCM10023246]|uniref:DUF2846 domain-containing protein n=1 Tax=Vogesella oryzagri TaxID=3160864 RepID=A0ABV1M8D4_9NEIS
MRWRMVLLLCCGLLAMPPLRAEEAASAAAGQPPQAMLYVLNNSGATLIASDMNITDNGQPLTSLPRGHYRQLPLAAGEHEFRFREFPQGSRVAKLSAAPGGSYYLLVAYSPGKSWLFPFGGDPVSIRLLPAEEAEKLLRELKPL